jgi:hypothetical protein
MLMIINIIILYLLFKTCRNIIVDDLNNDVLRGVEPRNTNNSSGLFYHVVQRVIDRCDDDNESIRIKLYVF